MKAPSIEELVQLPEPIALQRHFDAKNYRYFRLAVGLVIMLSLVVVVESATKRRFGLMSLMAVDLIAGVLLVLLRRERFYGLYFRQILLGFLALQAVAIKVVNLGDKDSTTVFIPMMLALLGFRLRFIEHLMIYVLLWLTAVFPLTAAGLPSADALATTDQFISVSVAGVLCLVVSAFITQLERKRFLGTWRTEHARSRERLRMREEIEYARKIQLSMLPQLPPDIGWVELAAASLPATEVGGDYYDYFRLSGSQLALVIGDVSGHGLASGLLLSGIRSCLYLLEKDLAVPVAVLDRLNPMVRKTTDRRTYVTLLCAVLDRAADGSGVEVTVASAGHPPLLCWDAQTGKFAEVGEGAPPLGTRLDAEYRQERHKVRRGDVLVLYTDGLVETRNGFGQDYGYPRLQKTVGRAAAGTHSVREIRDAILGDLSHFKGDSEQSDD
ncbi:MAG TPA: PP2C family protein-serine/threonine phosphatase, partial [Thermoanaerobaculia bacterium]|nr:PP2C family protein-serine/threonine phosphatase [Thermoanaerobaculia bacterium]